MGRLKLQEWLSPTERGSKSTRHRIKIADVGPPEEEGLREGVRERASPRGPEMRLHWGQEAWRSAAQEVCRVLGESPGEARS